MIDVVTLVNPCYDYFIKLSYHGIDAEERTQSTQCLSLLVVWGTNGGHGKCLLCLWGVEGSWKYSLFRVIHL